MIKSLSLLRAPCGLKQLASQPLQSCRASSALPRSIRATATRLGGHSLYRTLLPQSGHFHEQRFLSFGGWVNSPLAPAKDFHTLLLNSMRRCKINSRNPVYNEQISIQTRRMSDKHNGKKGENGTASEKDGNARYVEEKHGPTPTPHLLASLIYPLLP